MQLESHDLNTLRKIIRDLEEENRSLKSLLSDNGIVYESTSVYDEDVESRDVYDPDQGARIIKYAITRDMAKLFFYMFHGREDVYAKRGKKGGYFPQCDNRWNRICPKNNDTKFFCDEDCPYRAWKKIELDVIMDHLIGKKPECDDANTDDLWRSEVDALRKICKLNGIDALVERSRSGRGAHLWIFFSKPIQASLARSFGFAILDNGALSVNMPAFKYYDRMYPSQDVLSKIGNLVALPLQGRALQDGNSAFIDENWNAYPDQWDKLSRVKKISENEVMSFLQKWNIDKQQTGTHTKYADGQLRPWKKMMHLILLMLSVMKCMWF